MGLITKWTDGERDAPEPLEGDVVRTVTVGTIVWFLLFLGQLPFYGRFEDGGHTWWIWTCAAGAGLGLIGLWYVRRREAALRREADTFPETESDDGPSAGPDDGPSAGPGPSRPGGADTHPEQAEG